MSRVKNNLLNCDGLSAPEWRANADEFVQNPADRIASMLTVRAEHTVSPLAPAYGMPENET